MKVVLPINLPSLVPSDWERWWAIWNEHAQPLKKVLGNHNARAGQHTGFDIYMRDGVKPTYEAFQLDMKSMWPEFYDQVMSVPTSIKIARFVMSTGDFFPHCDNVEPSWQLRSLFYYTDPNPQWYFTRLDYLDPRWLRMPESTNWFAYLDGACKHGTRYVEKYPKILLQLFADPEPTKELVEKSFDLYPNYEINYPEVQGSPET